MDHVGWGQQQFQVQAKQGSGAPGPDAPECWQTCPWEWHRQEATGTLRLRPLSPGCEKGQGGVWPQGDQKQSVTWALPSQAPGATGGGSAPSWLGGLVPAPFLAGPGAPKCPRSWGSGGTAPQLEGPEEVKGEQEGGREVLGKCRRVGGAEVTQEPQAHLPQGEARILSSIRDRTGKAESPRAHQSRARPACAHRKLTAPLPAKQESPHFSEEPAEISESENQLLITGTQESGLEQRKGPQPVSRGPPESLSLQGTAVLRWANRGSGWSVGSAERAPCLAVGRTWGPPWGPPQLALAPPAWGLGPIQVETQSAGPRSRVTRPSSARNLSLRLGWPGT